MICLDQYRNNRRLLLRTVATIVASVNALNRAAAAAEKKGKKSLVVHVLVRKVAVEAGARGRIRCVLLAGDVINAKKRTRSVTINL